MKMRYQHLKIYRTASRILLPLTPVLIAIAIITGAVKMPSFLRDFSLQVLSPLWTLKNNARDAISPRDGSEECLSLQRASFTLRALERDNALLKELLERSMGEESLFVSASVLHSAQLAPYSMFIIDQGMDDGMREGMIVTAGERLAVGYISAVQSRTSTVTLFSTASNNLNAVLYGENELHIELHGQGSGSLRATVPRDIDVQEGDSVVLPSFEIYLVGTIVSIEVSPEDAYKTLYVRAPVNASELRYILVDTSNIWKKSEE